MKLSIAMIVKNEEKYIENTLKPLKKLQKYIDSEIVIVDTGSTDNTLEIAKQYTDKVYFHEWNNNFGDMRNTSINYCTGDWILIVDADEVLYDIEELARLIRNKKINKYNGLFVKIVNFNKDVKNSISNGAISPLLRIFKKGTVKYEGIVHEQPRFTNPIMDTNIRFIHYGYDNNNYKLMEYKFKRNLSLLMKELKKDEDNIYIIFQIAVSYSMHKDLKEALKYIEIAYEKAKSKIQNYIYVIDKYCFILHSLREHRLLLEKVEEALSKEEFIDFYFYKGESCYNLGKYEDAIEAYNKYLNFYEKLKNNNLIFNNTLSVVTRSLRDIVIYNLSTSYFKIKKYYKALNTILQIQDREMLKDKAFIIFKIIVEGKLWSELSILNGFIDKYNYESILVYVHKDVLLEDIILLSQNEKLLDNELKEIINIVKYFKENEGINKDLLNKAKKIIDENKIPYSIYIYYILKYDITEIEYFMIYGRDKIENILINLCVNYFDFNSSILEGLEKFKLINKNNINIKTIMEKPLLLSGNLPEEDKEKIFLNYIAHKYYCIIKNYNEDLVVNSRWMLTDEERFVLEIKEVLEDKYKDIVKYIRGIKDILNIQKSYIGYIKILTNNMEETVNNDIKALIPKLIESIKALINTEKYQDAYNTIEEALALVKFDFDLMVLKYNLLLQFNYDEEARICLRDIILYGDAKKIKELIYNL
ncbi:glycosyl transferase [Clostridium sporogenes]|uniref:Glycosyl transferase n=1 Tax=Clostridium sporogenes TaxID=1509 RepID=A0ABD6RRZ9_CLOSG|nr:glycosyltransferase family 2 protein [Clostridium sporogenes]OSB16888.1 glycosyl transferase [Clostridium sporogenes]